MPHDIGKVPYTYTPIHKCRYYMNSVAKYISIQHKVPFLQHLYKRKSNIEPMNQRIFIISLSISGILPKKIYISFLFALYQGVGTIKVDTIWLLSYIDYVLGI